MTLGVKAPEAGFAARVRAIRSPGGIDAWLLEDHTLPILSLRFGFRGGPTLDPPDRAGTARLLADLLGEGAGPFDGPAFRRALGEKGIRLFFDVTGDDLRGEMLMLEKDIDHAFALLGIALNAPRLSSDDLTRLGRAAASEARAELNRPDLVAARNLAAHGFGPHPYGRPARGRPDDLERISVADLAALRARALTRGNLRVALVGAIGPEAAGRALDRAFADLPHAAPESIPETVLTGLGTRLVTRLDLPQAAIRFARPGIPRRDPDFLAAIVAVHCLGGGTFSARLFTELRERRGLCYAAWATLQVAQGACTLVGATSVRNDRVAEAIGVIETEILRLREGLGRDELTRAKGYLTGSYVLRFDSSSAIAHRLLELQFDGRDIAWLDERNRRIAAVTEADIRRAVARLVGAGDLLVAVAGNPTEL